MRKTLVIVGAGVEQEAAYRIARAKGLEVVCTDQAATAPCVALADRFVRASTRDPAGTVAALEAHVQGYPGRHYLPRMASMNRPTYSAIAAHASPAAVGGSRAPPVVVFVSSRRQTRLTALDLGSTWPRRADGSRCPP